MTAAARSQVEGAKAQLEEMRGQVHALIADLSPVCGLADEYSAACKLDDEIKALWYRVESKARQAEADGVLRLSSEDCMSLGGHKAQNKSQAKAWGGTAGDCIRCGRLVGR